MFAIRFRIFGVGIPLAMWYCFWWSAHGSRCSLTIPMVCSFQKFYVPHVIMYKDSLFRATLHSDRPNPLQQSSLLNVSNPSYLLIEFVPAVKSAELFSPDIYPSVY